MKFFTLVLLMVCITQAFGQAQGFLDVPLKGEYLRDFYIIQYVDQDTSVGGFRDPYCGTKSYDGHKGVDFVIRDYRQMDSGVAVVSAASGIVFIVVDTAFDRNTNGDVTLGFGNYIGVWHVVNGKNYYTYYAHIKKNSHKVDSGTVVTAGQILGEVACSGYCLTPHLHFEVWTDSALVDPFAASCSFAQNSTTLWKNPLPYDTTFGIIQQGIFEHVPSLDYIRERPAIKTTYSYPADTLVTLWVEAKGIRLGDSLIAEWYTPKGEVWYRYATMSDADYWLGWWWSVIYHPTVYSGENGLWSVSFRRNGKLESTQSFTTVSTTGIEEERRDSPIVLTQLANTIFISSDEIHFEQASVRVSDILGNRIDVETTTEGNHTKRLTLRTDAPNMLFIQVITGTQIVHLKAMRR